jgi:hypothetical protein
VGGLCRGQRGVGADRRAAAALQRAARTRPDPELPERLDERFAGDVSTQEAFGRVLGALGRQPP